MSEPRRGRTTLAATAALLVGLATGGGVAWNLHPEPPEPVRVPVPEIREVPVLVLTPAPVAVECPAPEPERCVTVAVEWGGIERHTVCRDRWEWVADAAALRLEETR